MTEPRKFFQLIYDDKYDVSDVQITNDDCLHVTYKKSKEFQTHPHKQERDHCFLRHHSRQTGDVQFLVAVGRSCSVLRHRLDHIQTCGGYYNPSQSECVRGMTDELGGGYITEYVSNETKSNAYRTGNGIQVVKIKCFTLNYVASQQLTFDVMKEIAIPEQEEHIIVTGSLYILSSCMIRVQHSE